MVETGYYKKRPRREHREFLLACLASRRNVQSTDVLDDFRIFVTRFGQADIHIYLTNMYELGIADVIEILAVAPDTTCIVSTMDYNHYSSEAKAYARDKGVGLFRAREFLGAVYYDGETFLDYVPPEER